MQTPLASTHKFFFFVLLAFLESLGLSCNPSKTIVSPPTVSTSNLSPENKRLPSNPLPFSPETKALLQNAQVFSKASAQVAKQVNPGVVSIRIYKNFVVRDQNPDCIVPRMPPQYRPFLGIPFGGIQRQLPCQPYMYRKETMMGVGSGWIVDEKKGHVVTNNHVLFGPNIRVVFSPEPGEEVEVKAKVIGTDPATDLAVLQLQGDEWKKYATVALPWGESKDIQPGEWVLAFGNPRGLDHTVTAGVLSAKDRSLPQRRDRPVLEDFLQTDASVNPGNSGGPLVNLNGEVIGINTFIFTNGNKEGNAGSIGLNFAIPSDRARPIVQALIEHGKIRRSYIGASLSNIAKLPKKLKEELQQEYNLPEKGIFIEEIVPKSPADLAHLEKGDVLLEINGNPVHKTDETVKLIQSFLPGTPLKVTLLRNNKKIEVIVKTRELIFNQSRGEQDPAEGEEDPLGEE